MYYNLESYIYIYIDVELEGGKKVIIFIEYLIINISFLCDKFYYLSQFNLSLIFTLLD